MLVPEAIVVAADKPWLNQSDAIQVLLFIVALGALLWTIRETFYGGSVLRVELKLGRTDGKKMMSAPPIDFLDSQTVTRRTPHRVDDTAVDVAIITVVNKGRTPATILQPALEFKSSGAAPVRASAALLGGKWGESNDRVRVEAHDSRVFVMLLQPMVDAAHRDMVFQKPQGSGGAIWARGFVTSGTGKSRRSPRRIRNGFKWVDGRWKVRTPLLGVDATPIEQLLNDFLIPGADVYLQTVTLGSLFLLAKEGADVNELADRLKDDYNVIDAGAIAMRVHSHEARAGSDDHPNSPVR